MAYQLCSSPPTSLFHDRQPLCNSFSSSQSPKPKPRTFTHSFKLNSLSFHSKTATLLISHVSLQDPIIPQETQKHPNPTEHSNLEYPDGKTGSSPKNYIWVNPKSTRASQLRKKSYDSRYASLVKKAESLDSCNANEDEVFGVLSSLGDNILEQDAVVVIINNMVNPATVLFVLKYFQNKVVKFSREVILYNVTMKVFRKAKDLVRAEKLFDEMLERGINKRRFVNLIG